MTSRRYYSDSYTRVFTARVTETVEAQGSPAVVLDRTWFYPAGGGQPHDTGHLGSVPVVEVISRDTDGAVMHRLAGPAPAGEVEGVIDWPRRLDHMQQHSGQHILSAAFANVADAPTIGFHLGADYVSIDLGVRELTEAKAGDAEELANAAVRANLAVRAWFPEPDELAALPLRKTPDVQGALRVVAIGDFDVTACGGTHVAASGEVGQIKLLRTERLTRGIRVAFLSGDRARADYGKKHALVQELAGSLSCGPDEVPGAVSRLRASLDETRKELALWKAAGLRAEAEQLASAAEDRGGGSRVVLAAFEDRPADEIRELALRLTERPGTIALLGTSGARTQIVFARSEDLAADLRPGLDRALAELGGGRGGGGRVLQGGAGPADRARVQAALEAARAVVEVPA